MNNYKLERQLNDAISDIVREIENLEEEKNDLQVDNDKFLTEVQELNEIIEDQAIEIANLKEIISQMDAEMSNLLKELNEKSKEICNY